MPRTTIDKVGTSYRRFNDWLRGELRRRHIKQDTLAEYLNISRPTLTLRLNGTIQWMFWDVLKVMEYLDADFSEIL